MLPDSAPLYNHPLPVIETWLEEQGCEPDERDPCRWICQRTGWEAIIHWEETAFRVEYTFGAGSEKTLIFPYALSRADMQRAIFELEEA